MRGGLKKIRGRCFCFVGFRELSNWINRLILKLFFERFRHFKKLAMLFVMIIYRRRRLGIIVCMESINQNAGVGFVRQFAFWKVERL